jgi:hypothetical protein
MRSPIHGMVPLLPPVILIFTAPEAPLSLRVAPVCPGPVTWRHAALQSRHAALLTRHSDNHATSGWLGNAVADSLDLKSALVRMGSPRRRARSISTVSELRRFTTACPTRGAALESTAAHRWPRRVHAPLRRRFRHDRSPSCCSLARRAGRSRGRTREYGLWRPRAHAPLRRRPWACAMISLRAAWSLTRRAGRARHCARDRWPGRRV